MGPGGAPSGRAVTRATSASPAPEAKYLSPRKGARPPLPCGPRCGSPRGRFPLDLRHPGGPKGLPVEDPLLPRGEPGGVLVDGVGHLVGDGEDAVEPAVGQEVAQGEVVVPAPSLVGRADDRAQALEHFPLDGRQAHPVHPVPVQVVHDELGTRVLVNVVGGLVNLPPHVGAPGEELRLPIPRPGPEVAEEVPKLRVRLVVVLAVGVRDPLHYLLLMQGHYTGPPIWGMRPLRKSPTM